MRVKLISRHGLKAVSFFKKNKGKVFNVIQKRAGGYDVDLAPLGRPGEWGWMFDGEVEETAEEINPVVEKTNLNVYVVEQWSDDHNTSLKCDIVGVFADRLEAQLAAKLAAFQTILKMEKSCLLIREVEREDLNHLDSWEQFVLKPQNIS